MTEGTKAPRHEGTKWNALTFCVLCVLCGGLVLANDPPTDAPQAEPPPRSGDSLDDLLGIEEDERDERAEDAAQLSDEEALRRRLDEQPPADAFADAIMQMGVSAELLEARLDPGLGTQRVQEDILAKLAHLINEAQKQRCSSSSQQQSQQRQQQQQREPGRQQQDQQQQRQDAGDSQEGDPPPMQQGDINIDMDESRAEWGALPARVRDMLLQGRQERFSSLYEQLTREYYRRLAED